MTSPPDEAEAGFFRALDLGRIPEHLQGDLSALARILGAWWTSHCVARSLDANHVGMVLQALPMLDAADGVAVAVSVVATLPKDLQWKCAAIIAAGDDLAPEFAARLRERLLKTSSASRSVAFAWLAKHGALRLPDDAAVLLADRGVHVRALGTDLLGKLDDAALAPHAVELLDAATKERNGAVRRKLATLARKAARGSSKGDTISAPMSVARIQVEWDAGGKRIKARALLDALRADGPTHHAYWLARIAHATRSRSLRAECNGRLRLDDGEAGGADDAIDRAIGEQGAPNDSEAKSFVIGQLDRALIDQRELVLTALVRMLEVLGPRRAVLVETSNGHRLLAGSEGALGSAPVTSRARLVHPVFLSPEEIRHWRAELAARSLMQPLEQLERAVHRASPEDQENQAYLLDLERPNPVRAFWSRDWEPDLGEVDDAVDHDATCSVSRRSLGSNGIVVRWQHAPTKLHHRNDPFLDPSEPDDVFESIEFVAPSASAERVSEADPAGRLLRLTEVPPVVFSEVVRELTPARRPPKPKRTKRARDDRETGGASSAVDALRDIVERLESPAGTIDEKRAVMSLGNSTLRLIALVVNARASTDEEAGRLLGIAVAEVQAIVDGVSAAVARASAGSD